MGKFNMVRNSVHLLNPFRWLKISESLNCVCFCDLSIKGQTVFAKLSFYFEDKKIKQLFLSVESFCEMFVSSQVVTSSPFLSLLQLAFQKAISVEEKKISIVDSLNLETMEVEDKYDGPRLTDDNKVSVGFAQHLMQHYKAQKKLHRKYAFQASFQSPLTFCLP